MSLVFAPEILFDKPFCLEASSYGTSSSGLQDTEQARSAGWFSCSCHAAVRGVKQSGLNNSAFKSQLCLASFGVPPTNKLLLLKSHFASEQSDSRFNHSTRVTWQSWRKDSITKSHLFLEYLSSPNTKLLSHLTLGRLWDCVAHGGYTCWTTNLSGRVPMGKQALWLLSNRSKNQAVMAP